MAKKQSAGVVLYRRKEGAVEVFLVHPGGPFWAGKDEHAWSIPKGEFDEGEDPGDAARREFAEETGREVTGELAPLAPVRQSSGKVVHPFAVEGDCDADSITSNAFTLEWPPRSGEMKSFPEVDRAGWFTVEEALRLVHKGQRAIIDELVEMVKGRDKG